MSIYPVLCQCKPQCVGVTQSIVLPHLISYLTVDLNLCLYYMLLCSMPSIPYKSTCIMIIKSVRYSFNQIITVVGWLTRLNYLEKNVRLFS